MMHEKIQTQGPSLSSNTPSLHESETDYTSHLSSQTLAIPHETSPVERRSISCTPTDSDEETNLQFKERDILYCAWARVDGAT